MSDTDTMSNRKNQKTRLLTAFQNGKDFTASQIASRLNVSESRARYLITELRQDGYAIYRNRRSFSGGEASVYRLGTPSREMVALAALVAGGSIFA